MNNYHAELASLYVDRTNVGDYSKKVLSYRDQCKIKDQWLEERLETVLPELMKNAEIDMWLVIGSEYNEDPIMKTLLPASSINARGKMILAFFLKADQNIEKMTISIPCGIEYLYENPWYGMSGKEWKGKKLTKPTTSQFEFLNKMIQERNPKKIAINTDSSLPLCDGLTHSLYNELIEHLDPTFQKRLISSRELSFRWLEVKCESEIVAYNGIMQIAHGIIAEAFSSKVIQPGITTNEDVRYYLMQRAIDLGLKIWFDATVAVFRKGLPGMHNEILTIMPGDIIHCDFGFEYLNLCTDTQELGYILKYDEVDAPLGLRNALAITNRLQDIVKENIIVGKKGNSILKCAREQAIQEDINPWIYTHPIGFFGHGAGPYIGSFGNQEWTESGEMTILNNTSFSLELNAKVAIPEWDNQELMCCLETDILVKEGSVHFLASRQNKFHLIK